MFDIKKDRAAGVLLHPTSLPGAYGIGELGREARDFVDFLADAGMKLWQVLPLGPTGYGDSPYQSFSSFAGNHYMISLDALVADGLLSPADLEGAPEWDARKIEFGSLIEWKMGVLAKAFSKFKPNAAYKKFLKENEGWLSDYVKFQALKTANDGATWQSWCEKKKPHLSDAAFHQFLQFQFFTQWAALKAYANKKEIKIIGDIPIFVAGDSADVWASPELFQLDKAGNPTAVAGVPPDYFSETGQLWGNPLYAWPKHKKTGYEWWAERVAAALKLVDIVRIDHFRGFESYWAVPAREKTAVKGKWMPGPGKALFAALSKKLGELPIIAEDLGEITPKVDELRLSLGLPGMRVLQFGFQADGKSNHLPVNFESGLTVCYSGTHDNNTTHGWYADAPEDERDYLRRYMNVSGDDVAWDMIRLAFSTNAMYAIAPLQDILDLGEGDRMNSPGIAAGWWGFRYTADMLTSEHGKKLRYLAELFGRAEKKAD
jgi:4-alpha-glucanotransferase